MKIKEFIQNEIFLPKLKEKGVLVVYDPERRYRELCRDLASERRIIVDAGESSIESRLKALSVLQQLGEQHPTLEGLLVYVPAASNDEQRVQDPFTLYRACGAVFPDGDGDDFLGLCLRARPDHGTEIRQLFLNNSAPSFEMVDAIGQGQGWPQLQATLQVESARDILMAMLAPSAAQREALKKHDGWAQEARDLLRASLGLQLKTKGKTWAPIEEELWPYLLFSEFAFDLPGELPAALANVPRGQTASRALVDELCERLRSDLRTRQLYIEKAKAIETDFNLIDHCRGIEDLGEKDTFPFEERTFLRRAIDGLVQNDLDRTRQYLRRHKKSVWLATGESQAQWDLIQAAVNLIEICDECETQLPDHTRTQSALIDFYLVRLREADRLQREFEQAVSDLHDPYELMSDVIKQARSAYKKLAEKTQTVFIKHLETAGWPPEGRLANADVYDRFVGERLKDRGRKVAYLMVDALRYELGVALERLLADDGAVELHAAYAQMPTVTPVGMASLLPGAKSDLTLECINDDMVPHLAGAPINTVPQRMDAFRKRLGDRFAEMTLGEFLRVKPKLAPTVELLVLRTNEIDEQLESDPEMNLSQIPKMLQHIRRALYKLRGLKFDDAIIATDHGFFLNMHAGPGDECAKPQGKWPILVHDRMMLGEGESDSHNLVLPTDRLGIRGSFSRCALPRSYAPYRKGYLYFHGGASLAEAVVPVLIARLEAKEEKEGKITVILKYKNGADRITTRLPVIDIEAFSDSLFQSQLEIQLEAHKSQDKSKDKSKTDVVGEPRPGGSVNPATGYVTVKLNEGKPTQVVLKMHADFEGDFSIKAINPITQTVYASLDLKTDYTV